MRINSVKAALKEGKVQLGCAFAQLRSPEIPRILKSAGFHWAFIDMEHGNFDLETVQDICRVSSLIGFCPVVRVPDLQYHLVARALDVGAEGILFPRVESPELLEKAIRWVKFPPEGDRGFGLTSAAVNYEQATLPQIADHINKNTLIVTQIETQRAVDAREELLSVPGLDALLVGPADLSFSLGVPGEFQHPKMVAAMESLIETCNRHGVAPGTQARSLGLAKFWRDRGMRFLGCSSETGMMLEKATEIASALLS
ncbi:MAG: aldolase/citrate lyase family protein [Bryobacteraceae bacterium]|nr:aldolase/citrate lyase family protein [Bryobacteraceae bacterium]